MSDREFYALALGLMNPTHAALRCTECNRVLNELSISTIRGLCKWCAPEWAREVIIG